MAEGDGTKRKVSGGAFSRLTFRNRSLKTNSKDKKSKAPSSPGKDEVDVNQNRVKQRHSTVDLDSWKKPLVGIATQPFDAILPHDLSFNTGDHITVLTRTATQFDWWEGTLNGDAGIFPANYIKLMD